MITHMEQVGVRSAKNPVVVNYKDTYALYPKNKNHAPVFIAAMLYYDCVAHADGHDRNYQQRSQATTVKRAYHQELAAKCDSKFIPHIVAMEGRAAE